MPKRNNLTLTLKLADARNIFQHLRNTHETNPLRFKSLQKIRGALETKIGKIDQFNAAQPVTTLTA